ncbi:MAG: winged helix-turn-helix domain-containing protein [Acidimicrobiales bacterium]
MEVAVLRWPSQRHRRGRLRRQRHPRLLLVEGGSPPPEPSDCLEDWIRVPADEADVRARVEALEVRARHHRPPAPVLDNDGVLRVGEAWVALPPVEARLAAALVARMGTVAPRETLGRVGWPEGLPDRNALDVHVMRLRRRLGPLGLAIRTVRSRGYLLERSDTCQQGVQQA